MRGLAERANWSFGRRDRGVSTPKVRSAPAGQPRTLWALR
jgi:hypothetical protein